MAEVSVRALVLVIQLLDEKMSLLKAKIDRASPNDARLPGLEDELVRCGIVAAELRDSYELAMRIQPSAMWWRSAIRMTTR
jgi:hypothetical protein